MTSDHSAPGRGQPIPEVNRTSRCSFRCALCHAQPLPAAGLPMRRGPQSGNRARRAVPHAGTWGCVRPKMPATRVRRGGPRGEALAPQRPRRAPAAPRRLGVGVRRPGDHVRGPRARRSVLGSCGAAGPRYGRRGSWQASARMAGKTGSNSAPPIHNRRRSSRSYREYREAATSW